MIQRAYDIKERKLGVFTYIEFDFCLGWMSNPFNDHVKDFLSFDEAHAYGKKRGAFYVYS